MIMSRQGIIRGDGMDVASSSDDFKFVLHQLQIHDNWREAVEKATGKTAKEMNLPIQVYENEEKKVEAKNRSNSFSKLKRFLNIHPKSHSKSEKHNDGPGQSLGQISPGRISLTPSLSPDLSPTSPSLRHSRLKVCEDPFRIRAHSDSSAVNPRKKKIGIPVCTDRLRVRWPDIDQGENLTTTLRPRSYSHGSGERPAKSILKKSSSRNVYY